MALSGRVMDIGAAMLLGSWVRFEGAARARKVARYHLSPYSRAVALQGFDVLYADGGWEERLLGDRVTVYKRKPKERPAGAMR